ncbi:hypothetical protein KIL84_004272 [Mauremys mutica]|uniref:Uncharacterized protein n=1 Tax=Mauremys mutica TaxID=74926 RepID=A0A9D3XPD8_9SAUR|nr:hypothetical protein KIL84_004272 [Mauremys mutica]
MGVLEPGGGRICETIRPVTGCLCRCPVYHDLQASLCRLTVTNTCLAITLSPGVYLFFPFTRCEDFSAGLYQEEASMPPSLLSPGSSSELPLLPVPPTYSLPITSLAQ